MNKPILALVLAVCSLSAPAQELAGGGDLDALLQKSHALYQSEKYKEALQGYLQGMETLRNEGDTLWTPRYRETVRMTLLCYEELKRYPEKVALTERLLKQPLTADERKKTLADYSVSCLMSAREILGKEKKDYAEIHRYLSKGMPYAEGDVQQVYWRTLGYAYSFEAMNFDLKVHLRRAVELYLKSLDNFAKCKDEKNMLSVHRYLTTAYRNMELIDSALVHADAGIALARKFKNGVRELELLHTKSELHGRNEEWRQAVSTLEQVDSVISHTQDDRVRLKGFGIMAEEAQQNDNHTRAAFFYKEEMRLLKSLPPTESNLSALNVVYSKLRDLYYGQKDYAQAAEYSKMGLEYTRTAKLHSPILRIFQYGMLGLIYADMEKRDSCEQTFDTMKVLCDSVNNVFLDINFHEMNGLAYMHMADYDKAYAHYKEVERILDGMKEDDLSEREKIYGLLIGATFRSGKKDECVAYAAKRLPLLKKLYGEVSSPYVTGYYLYANAVACNGDIDEGARMYTEAANRMLDLTRYKMRMLPIGRRDVHFADLSELLSGMSAYALKAGYGQNEFTANAYDALLISKGMLLASEQSTEKLLRTHGTDADRKLYGELVGLRSAIKRLEAAPDKDTEKITALYRELLAKDVKLARQCSSYGDIMGFSETRSADVSGALKKKEVVVDFIDFTDENGKHKYVAYLLRKGQKYPQLVDVCEQAPVDSLLRLEEGKAYRLCEGESAEALRKLCLEPLLPYLHEGETVYFVPSGVFHQIPVDVLPLEGGALFGEKFNVVRLTSAREICRPAAAPKDVSAVLYGGLTYDVDTDEMALESRKYNVPLMFAMRGVEQGPHSGFRELPFSEKEVEAIGRTIEGKAGVKLFTRKHGTEESFIAMSGRAPKIIHLATHGFYYNVEDKNKVEALSGYTDAMNLTGLVMSGGNAEWTGEKLKTGVLGGLLTADDISKLDLSNTSLVCLSACNTGKGKVTPEGLYGLQRAFKKAGVKTLVMSLWEASDVAANLFMTEFYKQLVRTGWNMHKSFRHARKAVRKVYPEPFYWAGFVMVE